VLAPECAISRRIKHALAWFRRHVWGVAVVAVSAPLVALVRPIVQNGDAARYNEQVEAGRFASRAFHIGYIAIGYVFCRLLPGGTDWLMNLLTLVLGTGGALAVYTIARGFECSAPASFVAAVSLLTAPVYLTGSVASEVDVPMAALSVAALALWLRGKDKLAGAVFALAMLVTPLSSVALPAFLVPSSNRQRWPNLRTQARRIAVFAAVSLALYAPVVLWHRHSYFYSPRGVLSPGHGHIELLLQLRRSGQFFGAQPVVTACLLAGAVAACVRRHQGYVLGFFLVVTAAAVFGQRFADVPVHLVSTAVGAPLIAVFVDWTAKELRAWPGFGRTGSLALLAVILVALAAAALGSLVNTKHFVDAALRERALYREMQDAFPDDLVLVGPAHFAQAGRFMRALPRIGGHQARTLSRATLDENCQEFAQGRPLTFLLNRPPFRAPCRELDQNYRSVVRRFRKKGYHFLVPLRDGAK
jgi:hypothetical protein